MIHIKTAQEIECMRKAGRVVANALSMIQKSVEIGIKTSELDKILEEFFCEQGVESSFKGYMGYGYVSCLSVNSVVVHGVPSDYKLCLGDIIGVDIACSYKGYHADAARTFGVGKISGQNQKLIDVAYDCFYKGLEFARVGFKVGDISNAIQQCAESRGYSVVRELSGHGIGKSLHEDPSVPNFGLPNKGAKLRAGYALAIEPMINSGKPFVTVDVVDKWSCRTKDGSNSSHYENTVIVTDGEPEILTI